MPGVYLAGSNGTTPMFNNITTPGSTANASLTPLATIAPLGSTGAKAPVDPKVAPIDDIVFSNNFGWVSLFTVFPSWTTPAAYNNVQYVSLNNFGDAAKGQPAAPVGAAAYQYNVLAGWPSGNGKNAMTKGDYTSAKALNGAEAAKTYLSLSLQNGGGITQVIGINIDSAGAATPSNVTPTNNFSIAKAIASTLDVVTDAVVFSTGDVMGIIDFIGGIPATIEGVVAEVGNSTNPNYYITTDKKYPAQSKGISVAASLNNYYNSTFSTETLVAVSGDSQSLMYEIQSSNNDLPLAQQNAVFITTWRPKPVDNYSTVLNVNGADTLFITILNEGIYASTQIQQDLNGSGQSTQMAGGARYTPTKAQAQDSTKILAILTAISKTHPQDIKTVIELFGVHGKYGKLKNDPTALKSVRAELKAIFEKHSKEIPAIEPYLAKLAQKG